MPLEDLCRHQYLLHLPGGISYSSRLKYLLLCNSTVIILDDFIDTTKDQGYYIIATNNSGRSSGSDDKNNSSSSNINNVFNKLMNDSTLRMKYEEWYYPLLRPWVHYVPARNAMEVNDVMNMLQQNVTLAKEIAANGARFAATVFHPTCLTHYWISQLVSFQIRKVHNNLISTLTANLFPYLSVIY